VASPRLSAFDVLRDGLKDAVAAEKQFATAKQKADASYESCAAA
jgi:hypothetical protein